MASKQVAGIVPFMDNNSKRLLMFHLKSLDILNLDLTLKRIVTEVYAKFGLSVITSAYRPGDSGVHGQIPLRGIDLRCRSAAVGNYIANFVNNRYIYDPKRPKKKCALCHNTGKGLHIHLQSHPRTSKRGFL